MKTSHYVVACAWMAVALFWSAAAASALPLLIIGALTAWMLFGAHNAEARREKLRAELLGLAGAAAGDPGAHAFVQGQTGIAINAATGKIAMAKAGLRNAYAFGDVREWSSSKETAGQAVAVGGGLALGAMAAFQSGAAASAAAARSGFFVTVRDIDHPQWRVEMPDVDDQARWMEILRQLVNRD